jgi:hypothetical protein
MKVRLHEYQRDVVRYQEYRQRRKNKKINFKQNR